MKKYNYKIIHGSKEAVETEINVLLKDGWTLHGETTVSMSTAAFYFTQTMIQEVPYRDQYT